MAPHGDSGATTSAATMDAMGDSSHMESPHMMMVFQNEMATPIYSEMWTPTTTAGYAGTCIFLIFFAALLRSLLALKWFVEQRWLDQELKRRYVVAQGGQGLDAHLSRDSLAKRMVLSENGVQENVMVVGQQGMDRRPWRLSIDPFRAILDTIIVGVGYLLMLAVMTMNVGYFLSVLAGTFLGSIAIGRYTASSGVH